MTEVVYDTPVELEEDWVVTEPAPSIKTAGVVCAHCGEVRPKRRFIYGSKSYDECAVCRKARKNREAQRRWYAKYRSTLLAAEAKDAENKAALKRSVTAQVNRMMAMDRYRLSKMDALKKAGRGDARTEKGIEFRRARLAVYAKVLDQAIADIEAGNARPLAHYLEEYVSWE